MRVIIRAEAEAELTEAYQWYDRQRLGLGVEFLSSVEAALEAIRERPQSFPIVHKPLRRALVKRFPYSLLYIVEEDAISVLAVFHGRRDSREWRRRVP